MPNEGMSFPPEVYTKEETDNFFSTFTDSFRGRRNKCIFLLALKCQLRCNEILDLRPQDVNYEQGTVTVMKGKGGKRRVVGCDWETTQEIHRHHGELKERFPFAKYLFVSSRGARIDNSYVRKIAKSHGKAAGITKRVAPHCFRHSGACRMAEAGIELRVICKQLGHSNLAITSRYLMHLSGEDVSKAVQGMAW